VGFVARLSGITGVATTAHTSTILHGYFVSPHPPALTDLAQLSEWLTFRLPEVPELVVLAHRAAFPAAVRRVRNPITLARRVLESQVILLVGQAVAGT
jgi:hypothetical protein